MAHAASSRYRLEASLLVILLGLVLYSGVIGKCRLLNDADTLWHIVVGKEIFTEGFPTVDHYSFTRNGDRWLANQWLAECLMAVFDWLGGFDGVLLFAVLILAATYLFVAHRWLVRGVDPLLVVAMLTIVLSTSSYTFTARPHLFSIPLLAVAYVVLRNIEDGVVNVAHMRWLIALFLAWNNLHGGVLGGLGSLGLVAGLWTMQWVLRVPSPISSVKVALQTWLIVAACFAALVVNPYGPGALFEWLEILGMSLPDLIIEHAPLEVGSLPGLFAILLLLLYVGVFAATPGCWLRATFWLPLMWFVLTCTRIRHAPLFAIMAALGIADLLPQSRIAPYLVRHGWLTPSGNCFTLRFPRRVAIFGLSILLVLLAAAVWLRHVGPLPVVGKNWTQPTARIWPASILPALKELEARMPGATPIFNEPQLGGFLIYNCPDLRVFIDGRCELYGEPFLREFVAAWDDPASVDRWRRRYAFPAALIAADSPLREYFDGVENWRAISVTSAAVLYEWVDVPGVE